MKIMIEDIIKLVLIDAEKRRNDAGYAGRMDDGGASALKEQVEYYLAGMNGEIPENWQKYVKEIKILSDPEYRDYLRLKEKFGK